jgi:hypothetical protein
LSWKLPLELGIILLGIILQRIPGNKESEETMERPKSNSGSPKPDSKLEQSNVPAKPEKHKSFNVIKAEADEKMSQEAPKEKPSQPGDTSSGKGPEISEGDWQARRRQLVDEKMEGHEKNSKKIDTLKATATEHEKTISKHVQTVEGLIGNLSEIGMQYRAQRDLKLYHRIGPIEYERLLQALADIDSKEKLKEAHNSINDLYKDSDPPHEKFNEAEKTLKKAVGRILRYDIEKRDIIKDYIQKQEFMIENLTKLINDLKEKIEPKPSFSTGDAPPPEKRAGLEDTVKDTSAHHVPEGHGQDTEISKNPFLPQYEYLSASFVKKLKNLVDNYQDSAFAQEIREITAILYRAKVEKDPDPYLAVDAVDATRDLREKANDYREEDQAARGIAMAFEKGEKAAWKKAPKKQPEQEELTDTKTILKETGSSKPTTSERKQVTFEDSASRTASRQPGDPATPNPMDTTGARPGKRKLDKQSKSDQRSKRQKTEKTDPQPSSSTRPKRKVAKQAQEEIERQIKRPWKPRPTQEDQAD